ncbi:hypothetical protein MPRG_36410 [Mycobacterium paragordonae]|uniref:Uncharacterized protein n=1 Tax=Mycobacterium paragordonae TaxID=1389713 RepID=A0ABQ1C7A8_9MYCO|nr:hypothetical protein MPRG_36410 [Mycobacterium paragordonae]
MQFGLKGAFQGAQILIGPAEQAHHEVGRNIDAAANLGVGLPGYTSFSGAGLAGRHVVSAACFLAYGAWLKRPAQSTAVG